MTNDSKFVTICGNRDPQQPLYVVCFVSGTGGNLKAVLELQQQNPQLIQVGMVISDRPKIAALEIAKAHSIETVSGNFEVECGIWSECCHDPEQRESYRRAAINFHGRMLSRIISHEQRTGRKFDLAVLSYRRWIHGELLAYFRDRMINQHAGDLTRLRRDGSRIYTGVNPVLDALVAGDRSTRTSTIMVGEGHDTGEILCQGPRVFCVDTDVTRRSALLHEHVQKEQSDWPSLKFALRCIATGRFGLSTDHYPDGSRIVMFDGVALPFGGIDLQLPDTGTGDHLDH